LGLKKRIHFYLPFFMIRVRLYRRLRILLHKGGKLGQESAVRVYMGAIDRDRHVPAAGGAGAGGGSMAGTNFITAFRRHPYKVYDYERRWSGRARFMGVL
jgi:hypothetical protein